MSDKEDESNIFTAILALLAIYFIVSIVVRVILLVVHVILLVVRVILLIGLALLGGVGIIGFISGIFVGLKNFIAILIEAHQKLP